MNIHEIKEVMVGVLKRYSKPLGKSGFIGKVYPVKDGIRYGRYGFISDADVERMFNDMYPQ